jgi:hypothetical protein
MRTRLLALGMLLLSATAGAAVIRQTAELNGLNENPDVITPGTGSTTVTLDTTLHTLRIEIIFSGLIGNTTMAHIHCCSTGTLTNAIVASELPSFTGFPLGVTSGSYDHTFDTTLVATWSANFITAGGGTALGAETRLFNALSTLNPGVAYLNIHTSFSGSGEIRANFVPEPGTFGLMGAALAGLALLRRKR